MRGYARMLSGLFQGRPELGLEPPLWALRLLGLKLDDAVSDELLSVNADSAERAAERDQVVVTALS